MQKKDKQKVIGEVIDESKLRAFLDYQPYEDNTVDFHILLKAYRGLPLHEFVRFLPLYQAAGHALNPTDSTGTAFIDYIGTHRSQQAYRDALIESGA